MSDDAVKHDGLVVKIIDERTVVLNQGTRDDVSNGDRFLVFSLGEEIHDPKTDESLGILENIKGKGKVIHVQDRICTIETYEFDMEPVSVNQMSSLFGFAPTYVQETRKVYRTFVYVTIGDYARKI